MLKLLKKKFYLFYWSIEFTKKKKTMSQEKQKNSEIPNIAKESVLVKSVDNILEKSPIVQGYDFNKGIDYDALLKSYFYTGFQATNFGKAVEEINKMVWSTW